MLRPFVKAEKGVIKVYAVLQKKEPETKSARGISKPPVQFAGARRSFYSPLETVQRQAEENRTGIPDGLKSRFEALGGMSLDDVQVHYQSGKPAQLQAYAYTQGNQVYIGPGQERHLSHELGHVIQQKRGMVRPTGMQAGLPVNDDPALERQADLTLGAGWNGSGVVQKMPWHIKPGSNFPNDKLQIPMGGAMGDTDIKGENFKGFTYEAREPVDGADQTAATVNAAEFIAELKVPAQTELYKRDLLPVLSSENAPAFQPPGAETLRLPADNEYALAYALMRKLYNKLHSDDATKETLLAELEETAHIAYLKAADSPYKTEVEQMEAAADKEKFTQELITFKTKVEIEGANYMGHQASVSSKIDPFCIKVKTHYDGKTLNLTYQFAKRFYGYVVKVQRDAGEFSMVEGVLSANTYSHMHDTNKGDTIKSIAEHADAPSIAENNITYDAITKIAGEGARWQCVRDNAGKLKNKSRFYTKDEHDDSKFYYVSFEKLWKSWKTHFDNKFNIPNDVVVDKLKSTNLGFYMNLFTADDINLDA